jgi:hypothetical protein
MLPGLYDDERRSLKRLATMLILGAAAVLPLTTQSSSVAGAADVHTQSLGAGLVLPARLTFPGFSVSRDPFVPAQAVREKLAGTAMPTSAGPGSGTVIVRAIVLGDPARALVEESGTVQIIAVGDRIGELRVIAITAAGITLSDGSHLMLAVQRQ